MMEMLRGFSLTIRFILSPPDIKGLYPISIFMHKNPLPIPYFML